ncbi:hypothetical protein AAC387_Pa05g1324 [Persea americana]|eukprot:TRINITY_DN845_c0_g1_i1.p1 TRINITY_DN845_c0_g1~~TRINITY_DN845_c0_g1_i1.p1  ORF type:complete len:310 (+),score=114.29 TRINITY_DN845_c0_g1_i1:216-1145(+)
MEFWGVEVKAGEPVKCDPGFKTYLHLSQASLGEVKKDKGNDSVPIFVEVNGQKLVLGVLSPDNCTHIPFDLVFEKEFVLSHNWKNGSVYFCGYKSVPEDSDDFTDTDTDSEEAAPALVAAQHRKGEVKNEKPKPAIDNANAAKVESKPKAKQVELKKVKDEDDDDDEESDEEEDSDDDEDMVEDEDESNEDEDGESSDDEEEDTTVKKAETGKKRAAESAVKTPIPEKKAKLASPIPSGQKKGGDGKKGGHTATPYPSKKGGKTPASNDKPKLQTPKSGGQVTCKSCSRTFNSENALDSHTKAKHSTGK